jgi:hypothetical protein
MKNFGSTTLTGTDKSDTGTGIFYITSVADPGDF